MSYFFYFFEIFLKYFILFYFFYKRCYIYTIYHWYCELFTILLLISILDEGLECDSLIVIWKWLQEFECKGLFVLCLAKTSCNPSQHRQENTKTFSSLASKKYFLENIFQNIILYSKKYFSKIHFKKYFSKCKFYISKNTFKNISKKYFSEYKIYITEKTFQNVFPDNIIRNRVFLKFLGKW